MIESLVDRQDGSPCAALNPPRNGRRLSLRADRADPK